MDTTSEKEYTSDENAWNVSNVEYDSLVIISANNQSVEHERINNTDNEKDISTDVIR